MEDCKVVSCSLVPHSKLSKFDDSPKFEDPTKYHRLIGSFWYLTNSRPDLCHSVGTLGQLSIDPHVSHARDGLRVLKYTAGTVDYGITYTCDGHIIGYSDAD